jgi:hypothetical protein
MILTYNEQTIGIRVISQTTSDVNTKLWSICFLCVKKMTVSKLYVPDTSKWIEFYKNSNLHHNTVYCIYASSFPSSQNEVHVAEIPVVPR